MNIVNKNIPFKQQPSGSGLRPALLDNIKPTVFWLPQMGSRIWTNSGICPATAIGISGPRLVDVYKGRTYSSVLTNAGIYWNITPIPVSYPCYVGGVFTPRVDSVGNVFSISGDSGSNTSAPFFEVVWLGFNQLQARAKMALSGTQISITDFNVSFTEPTAFIAIARSSTELVLITNNGYQVNTSSGSTPSSETWGYCSMQGIKRGTGVAVTSANVFTLMGFAGIGDPGDTWAKNWVKDPWSIVSNTKRRVPLSTSITVYQPGSDIIVAGWTPSTGTDLFACIDETIYDDGDYISSPGLGTPTTMGFTSAVPTGTYTIQVRGRYDGIIAGQVRIVMLDSGGSIVGTSSWATQTTSFATYSLTVTTTGIATKFRIETQ